MASLPRFEPWNTHLTRCHAAEESEQLGEEVRFLLHGKRNRRYNVHYAVQQTTPSTGTVRIFHVRHWARRSLDPDQLRKLINGPTGADL